MGINSWSKLNTARILIISDAVYLANVLQNILSDAGYLVAQAYSVDDALQMADYNRIDLALVDLRVSDNDPQAILEALREDSAFGRFPWIALMDNSPNIQNPDGASGVVFLPVRTSEVLNAVAETLRRLQAQQEFQRELPPVYEGDDLQQQLARNVMEQQTISELIRTLNSTLDLNAVLTKVVDAATRLTRAEEGLLLLPEDDGSTLYIRAGKGIDNKAAQEFRVKTRDSLAGRVFKTGEPLLIAHSGWHKVKTSYYVQSLLYVPLKIKGQDVIGVMGVNNRTSDRAFSDHDKILLEDLASHAAVAIENARLYEETVTRSKELSVLVKTSEAVNSTLSLEAVLRIISEQLINALNVEWCEITTWDKSAGHLNVLASSRQVYWVDHRGPHLPVDKATAFQRALTDSRSIVPNDSVDYSSYVLAHHAQQSWLVPLQSDNEAVGVLELLYFSKKHRGDLHLPLEIDPTNLEDWKQTLVSEVLHEAKADIGRLWLLNPHDQILYQHLNIGCGVWLSAPQPKLNLRQLTPLLKTLQNQKPLHITANTEMPSEHSILLDFYCGQTVLALPLINSGQVLGLVLLIDTANSREFSEREINLAQALVLQAANALQNARLYHDLQISMEKLRRTQSKLVQSARMSAIGQLAAAVAHQINNPLTTVLGDTEMLMQDRDPYDPDMVSLQAVYRAGQRAHEVVRRLLSMSYQDKDDTQPEAMNVNITIDNTLSLVRSHIQRTRVDLVVELTDDLPPASGLRGQLEDVWLNLLLNARDAVKESEQPTIGIHSYLEDEWVKVEVWDNGPGIPEEIRHDVFEAFFTTKESGEGTGLGLHICRQVVEKCHGKIEIQPREPHGVIFVVSLPVQPKKDEVYD